VSELTAPFAVGGQTFPAGTWVVPTDQEFAAMAREVLDVQRYPDLRQYPGGPPERPYDAAGWSLPLQMGVRVVPAMDPLSDQMRGEMRLLAPPADLKIKPTTYEAQLKTDSTPFDSLPGIGFDTDPSSAAIVPPPGGVTGSGPALVVDPAQNNAFKAINQAWRQGASVHASAAGPRRFTIQGLSERAQDDLVKSLALQAERTASAPARAIRQPRIGLYQPWSGSMGEGWTRWVFEQYGFQFVTIHPEDFQAPLAQKVDVLVIADDARVPIAASAGGAATQGRVAAGRGAIRPEHAYQLTAGDLERFEQFVRGGGTVVCVSNASGFAIQQLKLPVRNVVAGLKPEEFFLRGSIVEVATDPSHPVMAGMPDKAAIFVDGSPVFETLDGFAGKVLARYQDSGSPLLSGYLIGDSYLHGKAAALDVPLDAGHVVLLGFRPEWRGQPFGAFRVLFNTALLVR